MSRILHHALRARNIKATLGTRSAAGYLRNNGFSLEACMFILLGRVS